MHVFLNGEGDGTERMSSELDASELDGEGEDEDDREEGVIEEVLEDVDLSRFQLPGVDLVEDLKQHEGMEEDAVMFSGLDSPLLSADR